MSATTFTMKLSPLKKKRAISEDDAEEVSGEILAAISSFLEGRLTRDAEAKMLEDIDACAESLVELDYAALQKAKLTFHFHEHWLGGAQAAAHWYSIAMVQCKEPINEILEAVEFCLEEREFSAMQQETKARTLVTINGSLFALDKAGTPLVAEGETVSGSESEQARWRELVAAQRCQCQLCA